MNRKITLLISLLFLLGLSSNSYGQGACPPNIDFEDGNVGYWNFYIGSCCPIVTPTTVPATPGRHNLTAGSGTDYYGGFPIVSPSGGAYSMRLGNDTNGSDAEKARYYVRVPTASANYALVYRYAVVFEDPGHSTAAQPRFEVNAIDSATGITIPCATYNYVSSSSLPGFFLSSLHALPFGGSEPVYYKGWTTAMINLSGLSGTTVIIDFASGDCGYGGHFGYGYFDMSCGLFQVAGLTCDDTATSVTLSAPFGYEFYHWYDSATFTVSYGTTQTITIPIPAGPTTYAVVLTPYVGYGCPDTLYTKLSPSHLALNPTPDTLICNGFGGTITSGATDIALPLSYSWSPASGLSCTNCATPIASPATATVYTVTVTNAVGCVKDTTIRVEVGQVTTSLTHVDDTCAGFNNGSATVTVLTGLPPFSYLWTTTPVQTTPIASGLYGNGPTGSITYTITVTDATGCKDVKTATVLDGPRTVLRAISSTNPTICNGADGTITLDSLVPGTPFTIHYLFNGVYQTQTLTAPPTWRVVLSGLRQGNYTNIGVITNHCQYNTVFGPISLYDPLPPATPAINSNSPVCLGNTINLSALSVSDSTTYTWSGPNGFSSAITTPFKAPAVYADSGVYKVVVQRKGCYDSNSLRMYIYPLPFPAAISNSPVCSGDTLFLAGSSSNGATSYTWRGPDGFYRYNQNPYIDNVPVTATGTYTVTVNLNGCTAFATTDVIINQTPVAPTVSDTEYCQFDVVPALKAGGTNLKWYNKAIGGTGSVTAPVPPTLLPGKNTWYVSQVSAEGCEGARSAITVQVDYFATPKLDISDSVICKGTDIMFTAMGTGDDMTRINWYFSDGDSIINKNPIQHSFDYPGQYSVTATAYYKVCAVKTASRTVTIYPAPSVYLGGDTSICPGGVAIILGESNASGPNKNAKWAWSTGSSQSYLRVTQPGTYFVKVSIDGCYSTDSIVVYNDCYMNLPNVFTPNGDGLNDYFFPRQLLTKGLTMFKMDIYNRWGQLVFTSNTLDGRGWDGKLNNVAQPEGVFVYIIDATFKDGQHEHHQGNVTLLR